MLKLKYLSCFVLLVAIYETLGEEVVIQINNGQVRGRSHVSQERRLPFYSFRGIPFAEPPVGNRRFELPVAKSNWGGVWDATQDRNHCVQGSNPIDGAEDCLYINVYTPVNPSKSCTPLPTLVWIYGGGFEGGTSNYDTYGPDHLLEENVVIVTFNYRLGFLGFVSTGDTVAPGNNGLKDQLLALKWVRDNVGKFCGNPNDITLAGQSAGSASVAYHIQSPSSKGLFHKAILESGTSLSLWALSRNIPAVTKLIAENLKVDTSSSRSMIDGLKQIDINLLQNNGSSVITAQYLSNNPREGFIMGPVPEPANPNAFFTTNSHQALSSGNFNKVPILIGYNSLEGSYNFELAFRLFLAQYDLDPKKLLPAMNCASNVAATAGRELKSHYFGWIPVSLSNMEVMRFLSDDQFARSIREFARIVSKDVPVYLYRFSYEGGLWGIHNRTIAGVTHSEELGYFWISKHDPIRDHDFVIRSRMIKLWTNFVKHGNPTPSTDAVLQNVIWDTTSASNLAYVDIGENLVKSVNPESANMKFWDSFYAKYGNPPYTTY